MAENENNDTLEITSEDFKKKADRILSVIKNINCQGGITTQLMMAAACIEVQAFQDYLHFLMAEENEIDRNTFLSPEELDKYIRDFKDAEDDLFSNISDDPEQREIDEEIIRYLEEEAINNTRLIQYEDCNEYLESWGKLETDYEMLWNYLYEIIRYVNLGLEDIYQILRKSQARTKNKKHINKKGNDIKIGDIVYPKERKIDLIKILHAMCKIGLFKMKDGSEININAVIIFFGKMFNQDWSKYSSNLSMSKSNTKEESFLEVFDELRNEASKYINNS